MQFFFGEKSKATKQTINREVEHKTFIVLKLFLEFEYILNLDCLRNAKTLFSLVNDFYTNCNHVRSHGTK